MQRKKLGEILIETGIISPEQLEQALALQRDKADFLGQILVEKGWSTEEEVCRAVSVSLKVDFVQIEDSVTISQEIIQLAPESLATQRKVLPLFTQDNTLYLAMENPLDYEVIQRIATRTDMHIRPLIATASTVRSLIKKHYDPEKYLGGILENTEAQKAEFSQIEDIEQNDGSQIEKLAKILISTGLKKQAREIYFEPISSGLLTQYQINGTLSKGASLPVWLQTPLLSKIKTLFRESNSIKGRYQEKKFYLSMETQSNEFGEKLVLQISDTPMLNAERQPPPQSQAQCQQSPIRILVADDEAPVLDLVRELLTQKGYQIIPAVDGEEALEKIRTELPDLVILDIVMPKQDGFSVCKTVRSTVETMFIPIIMLTAQDSIEEKLKGLQSGADDYITKPFNSEELIARIEVILKRVKKQ